MSVTNITCNCRRKIQVSFTPYSNFPLLVGGRDITIMAHKENITAQYKVKDFQLRNILKNFLKIQDF